MKKIVLILFSIVATMQSPIVAQSIADSYFRCYAGPSYLFVDDVDGVADSGLNAGLLYGLNITAGKLPFFLQLGGEFVYEGANNEDEEIKERLFCLAVPLNLSYKLGVRKFNVEPFIGANLRLNLYGHAEGTGHTLIDTNYFDSREINARRFMFGVNLGLNFNIKDLSFGLRLNPDLMDYSKEYNSKFLHFFLTMGYTL
jgi:hypothetical protein